MNILFILLFLFHFNTGTTTNDSVFVDGSSTVYPILNATGRMLFSRNPNAKVSIETSGTGGGFRKFCTGQTDINGASRRMNEAETACANEHNIQILEIPVAVDGLTIVVHPSNTFISEITVAELREIWRKDGKIRTWRDLRAHWPDEKINLYTRGTTSGTYDFFNRHILNEGDLPNPQFTGAPDDTDLLQLITADLNALGIIGFSYYVRNHSRLKNLAVDNGRGPVSPNYNTINNSDYTPLSRNLYLYINAEKLKSNPELQKYLDTLFDRYSLIIRQVGYIPLNDRNLELVKNFYMESIGAEYIQSQQQRPGSRQSSSGR